MTISATKPDRSVPHREATPEEFKAMAHPLRMRILRACLYESRANKEIAEALDIDPGTCLHHVRLLVKTGFLEADAPRAGKRGSIEKPYRATGKSWSMEYPKDASVEEQLVMLQTLRDELLHLGPERIIDQARLGLKLSKARAKQLHHRLMAVVYEYAEADPDPDGYEFGMFILLHAGGDFPLAEVNEFLEPR